MNIVDDTEYNELKHRFFSNHNNDFQCETEGTSAEYYRKTYIFTDGAIWYEVMQKKTIDAKAKVYNIEVPTEVDVFETEFWSSSDAESKYCYEPWYYDI